MKLSLSLLLALGAAALAEPVTLPLEVGTLRTRDGKTYEQVKIVGEDDAGVKILHAGGIARLGYERLPKELASRLGYDAAAAEAKAKEKEAARMAALKESAGKPQPKPAEPKSKPALPAKETESAEEGDDPPVEKLPETNGKAAARIAELEAYIRRLEAGIREANIDIEDARRRAESYRGDATSVQRTTVNPTTGTANVQTQVNSSKMLKARYHDGRADRLLKKISEAERLIGDARAKIGQLQKMAGGE